MMQKSLHAYSVAADPGPGVRSSNINSLTSWPAAAFLA